MNRLSTLRSTGLILALAVAATAPLLHCSSPAPRESSSSGGAVTGVNNALGLKLTYDASSSHVRATVRSPLGDGEKLFVRLRRGTITETSEQELDCGALHEAPPIDATPDGTARDGVVYDGPDVDPALLDPFYGPEWGQGVAPTQAMLDALDRGPDAIVEACVTSGADVRAKMQVTLPYAWDEGNAQVVIGSGTPGFAHGRMHLLAETADGGAQEAGVVTEPVDPAIHSMEKYAELCVKELGEIPFFPKNADGTYGTYDCRKQGVPVPVTVTDKDGRVTEPDTEPSQCDKPQYLRQNCEPGVVVQSATNDQGSRWVLLCRAVEDDGHGMKNTDTFNDIAMIGNNPVTGKTCFFQNKLYSGKDGAHVPHPADPAKSSTLWTEPEGYCNSCHSADPFVHSPWIDGAKRPNGQPVVPKMGVDPAYELANLDAPFSIVHAAEQGWTMRRQLVNDEAGACTACHRMGEGNMMESFSMWSAGDYGDWYGGKVTDAYKVFAKSHTMPPSLGALTEATWAASKFGKAVAFIKGCNDGTSTNCQYAPIPSAPLQ